MLSKLRNHKNLAGLGIVAAILTAMLLVGIRHLTVVEDRVTAESRTTFLSLSQLQREQLALSHAFVDYQAGPNSTTHEALVETFGAFRGRLLILRQAQEIETSSQNPKTFDFAERLLAAMEWLEPSIQALPTGDAEALATVVEGLQALDEEMQSFILSSYRDPVEVSGFWREATRFAGVEFGLVIGAIVLAMAVFVFLIFRAAQRAETLLRLSQEAQVAQRQSEARFAAVAELASEWFWETDADGRWTYISERFEQIFGLKPDSLLGKPWVGMFDEANNETNPDPVDYLDAVRNQRSFRDFVHEEEGAEGRRLVVRSSGRPVYDDQGKFSGYRGASCDITAEVEARQAVAAADEQLHQSRKLQAIGQLTGGIAHDFNNLLSVVSGNAEVLRRRYGEEEESISMILKMADQGANLTGRLRAFSRQQALAPDKILVTDLLHGVSALLDSTLGQSIEITLNAPPDGAVVELDRGQLENAILNLAINARDAMPSGGRLSITAESGVPTVRALPRELLGAVEDYLVLTVADNGVGIPVELQERIFEPFFSTKAVSDGNGLGLSMVHDFVTQAGGAIDISSKLGKGTEVRLFLPLASQTAAAATALPTDALQCDDLPPGDGQRILVVEDDDDVRSLTAKLLTFLGYKVDIASSGEEALEFVGQEPKVDLVITDIVLSGALDGLETARAIEKKTGGTPVIFMSGYPDDVLRKDHLDLGDVEIITKPFRIEGLAHKIFNVLGLRKLS